MRYLAMPVLRCDNGKCGRQFVALYPGLCDRCQEYRAARADAVRDENMTRWLCWTAERSERQP